VFVAHFFDSAANFWANSQLLKRLLLHKLDDFLVDSGRKYVLLKLILYSDLLFEGFKLVFGGYLIDIDVGTLQGPFRIGRA
jgi:hypothetical protein